MDNSFRSSFADDLCKMIELKTSLGSTEDTYRPRAIAFDRHCQEKFPDVDLLSKTVAFSWMYDSDSKDTRSIHYKASFLKTFGIYQKAVGKDAFVLSEKFSIGRERFIPYLFTDEELRGLFLQIDNWKNDSFRQMILKTYFRLTYTCGLRPAEGRNLKTTDVDLRLGEIQIVYTKWGKSRTIVMSDDMAALMESYSSMRAVRFPDSEFFFPASDGSPYTAQRMQGWFKKMFAASKPEVPAELLPSVRVYDLRHRFATAVLNRWLDQGKNLQSRLPYLQSYMGHKDLESTMYYIHLLPENLVRSSGIDWEKLNRIIPREELWEK